MLKDQSHKTQHLLMWDVMEERKTKFLNFATIYIVFLLKNVANEIKAFRSLLKISDYKLIQNIFALIISKQISL